LVSPPDPKGDAKMMKGVNWIAVIVAIILVQVLGFLWYGPLFGSTWHALDPGAPSGNAMDAKMAGGIAASAVMVIGIAWLFARLGVAGLMDGLRTALVLWIVFPAMGMAMMYCYEGRSLNLVAFNAAYDLVCFLLIGAALTLLRGRGEAAAATA
jgi:hypothetical protein